MPSRLMLRRTAGLFSLSPFDLKIADAMNTEGKDRSEKIACLLVNGHRYALF